MLKVPDEAVKVSLRSAYMLPTVAVVDPLLTLTMPPHVTASTGLDALTQCLEPYVSSQSNPLADAIAVEGLKRAARSLRRAYEDGADVDARTDMSLASLFGGLALANAKLGAVHGFAGVLGGMYPAPHGIVCARLLPFVVETNVMALGVAGAELADTSALCRRCPAGDRRPVGFRGGRRGLDSGSLFRARRAGTCGVWRGSGGFPGDRVQVPERQQHARQPAVADR